MEIVLAALAVVAAGFAVWIAVRVINRPEKFKPTRWRCLILAITMPLLYLLAFGPACWINERTQRANGNGYTDGWGYNLILTAYRPILNWASQRPHGSQVVYWFAELGVKGKTPLGIQYVVFPNGDWRADSFHWERDD